MKNYNKMSENIKIPVFENFKNKAHITKDKYDEIYKFSLIILRVSGKRLDKELIDKSIYKN